MELTDYLAIPFVLSLETIEDDHGRWTRRAAYPELGCSAEATTPLAAIELLERRRIKLITDLVEAGEDVPAPRRPLHDASGWSELTAADLLELAS